MMENQMVKDKKIFLHSKELAYYEGQIQDGIIHGYGKLVFQNG